MKLKIIFFISFILLLLSGCSSTPDDSVVKFVADVKKTNPGYSEKTSNVVQVAPVKFSVEGMRDPFDKVSIAKPVENDRVINGPDPKRPREVLEGFPLESIMMVGTLEKENKFYALLKDRNGVVHIVGIGNYVGENAGKIVGINDSEVDLIESLPDGKGGWRDHKARIPLIILPEQSTGPGTGSGAGSGKGKGAAPQKSTVKGTPTKRATTKGSSSKGRGAPDSGQSSGTRDSGGGGGRERSGSDSGSSSSGRGRGG